MEISREKFIKAIQKGDLNFIESSLGSNPKLISEKTDQGISVLLLAMYYQKKEIVDVLLQNKKELDFFEAAAAGRLDFLQKKLDTNSELLNQYAVDGFTALGLASFFSQKEVVEFLLEKGADPNIASNNSFKVAPIHSATASKQIEIVKLLLQKAANPNAKQSNGVTALHSAAHLGELEIVELFLKNGGDKTSKTEDGKTALDFAKADGFSEIVKLLES